MNIETRRALEHSLDIARRDLDHTDEKISTREYELVELRETRNSLEMVVFALAADLKVED